MTPPSSSATSQDLAPKKHGVGFESLLEAVPEALLGVDRAGVIRYINRQAESLFGYDRGVLIGQPIETLVPESVRAAHPAHREGYFAGPGNRRPAQDREGADQEPAVSPVCLHGRQRHGGEFPLNLSLSQIDTEDGLLVIAAVRDMSEAENPGSTGQPAPNFEPAVDAMIGIGPDGIITSWNPAAERMYGYSSQEMVGKSGWVMVPDRAPG